MGLPATDLAAEFPAGGIPKAPLTISVGVPAELLSRRPDILVAERRLAAESARIGIAQSDFYPRVSINGFLGYTAKDLSELYEPKSFTGVILPTVQWPILNYGRIVNGVRAQDARFPACGVAISANGSHGRARKSKTPWPASCKLSNSKPCISKTKCGNLIGPVNWRRINSRGEQPISIASLKPKRRW